MALTRRHFVGLSAGLGLMPLSELALASSAPAFLSAYRDQTGAFGVAALNDSGTVLFTEILPARGHDTVISPDHRFAVTFARRPGRFAMVVDLMQQAPAFAFEAAQGRHFYGHGFFSPDGRLLYATENNHGDESGVLGVYDVGAGYRRIGEFDTHGIGPHETLLLDDGRTIAVANGGILTHPDYPRQKLNLSTMTPSLTYLDRETGDLLEKASLPPAMHQLSIRHLTTGRDGSLWFGGQYEGAPTDPVELIGRHHRGGDISLIALPDADRLALRHYVGSIKSSHDGQQIALTSPRGGVCVIVNIQNHAVTAVHSIVDVCGVAAQSTGFALSTGQGRFVGSDHASSAFSWDNHLRSVRAF